MSMVRFGTGGRITTPVGVSILGDALHDVTFVVLDLETTGGSPEHSRITEVGAMKVRGGHVLGEFSALINPLCSIPPQITALTGISDAMVAPHPPIDAVLPMLLEFLVGTVFVAHNARFDFGFLNASLARLDYPVLSNPVLCTATLARRLVRDEVRNCRLATLAAHFRSSTSPNHRALTDARATVDVLHGLIERTGSFGVATLEDLLAFSVVRNAPVFRSRLHLTAKLPRTPGVYAFTSEAGELLYVGKATELRARVRSYFGTDSRRWIEDMVRQTADIRWWSTATAIEAEVHELRLIHEARPRYNRRSKHPDRAVWLKLTDERFPRLSTVRRFRVDSAAYLGPLSNRRMAQQVTDALQTVTPIRRCTDRIGVSTRFPACALAEMGRCGAPCEGRIDPVEYRSRIAAVTAAFDGDPTAVITLLRQRLDDLVVSHRFEEAAETRNRLATLLVAIQRSRRLEWLATAGPLVAARPLRNGQYELVAARGGALVASAVVSTGELDATAVVLHQQVAFGMRIAVPSVQECDLVGRWLERSGVRLLHCDGRMAQPRVGGEELHRQLAPLKAATRSTGRPSSELANKRIRRDRR